MPSDPPDLSRFLLAPDEDDEETVMMTPASARAADEGDAQRLEARTTEKTPSIAVRRPAPGVAPAASPWPLVAAASVVSALAGFAAGAWWQSL